VALQPGRHVLRPGEDGDPAPTAGDEMADRGGR
jgi:hypothetical protein